MKDIKLISNPIHAPYHELEETEFKIPLLMLLIRVHLLSC
jgi:hypothetical protein